MWTGLWGLKVFGAEYLLQLHLLWGKHYHVNALLGLLRWPGLKEVNVSTTLAKTCDVEGQRFRHVQPPHSHHPQESFQFTSLLLQSLKSKWMCHKYGSGHNLSFLIEEGNRAYFCPLVSFFPLVFISFSSSWGTSLLFFFLLLESNKDHKVKVPNLSFHGMQVIITMVPRFQASAQK